METIKQEPDIKPNIKQENEIPAEAKSETTKLLSFQCSICEMKEKYDYFGMNPPYMRNYLLLEDSYVIEDPFLPPKQGEFIILGANCVKCKKAVCKSQECSIYFDKTICLKCAKSSISTFPVALQEKINKFLK